MMQLGKDPEEAAQMAGAGWMTRMRHIVLPIQKGHWSQGYCCLLSLVSMG